MACRITASIIKDGCREVYWVSAKPVGKSTCNEKVMQVNELGKSILKICTTPMQIQLHGAVFRVYFTTGLGLEH